MEKKESFLISDSRAAVCRPRPDLRGSWAGHQHCQPLLLAQVQLTLPPVPQNVGRLRFVGGLLLPLDVLPAIPVDNFQKSE